MNTYLDLAASFYPDNQNYHSLKHIENLLYWYDLFKDKFLAEGQKCSEHEMKTAIVYHDAVYIPGSASNEYDSIKFMNRMGVQSTTIEHLIMSTIVDNHHIDNWKNYDIDCKILHDLDWFGFSIPTEIYAQTMSIISEVEFYCRNKFSRKEILQKRIEFLNSIKDLDIFQTKTLKAYNKVAKENIQKHIETCKILI